MKLIRKELFRGTGVLKIDIPDGVEALYDECFSQCASLSRVTFGESSSLKLIGKEAFYGSGVREIHAPARAKMVCDAGPGYPLIAKPRSCWA